VRRQPIYEIDRLDPVGPSASLHLDSALLDAYPEGHRIWPICSAGSASMSRQACLTALARRWNSSTHRGEPGWAGQAASAIDS
jgi:hypothetical protein